MVWPPVHYEYDNWLYDTALWHEPVLYEGTGSQKCINDGYLPVYHPLRHHQYNCSDFMHCLPSDTSLAAQQDDLARLLPGTSFLTLYRLWRNSP